MLPLCHGSKKKRGRKIISRVDCLWKNGIKQWEPCAGLYFTNFFFVVYFDTGRRQCDLCTQHGCEYKSAAPLIDACSKKKEKKKYPLLWHGMILWHCWMGAPWGNMPCQTASPLLDQMQRLEPLPAPAGKWHHYLSLSLIAWTQHWQSGKLFRSQIQRER